MKNQVLAVSTLILLVSLQIQASAKGPRLLQGDREMNPYHYHVQFIVPHYKSPKAMSTKSTENFQTENRLAQLEQQNQELQSQLTNVTNNNAALTANYQKLIETINHQTYLPDINHVLLIQRRQPINGITQYGYVFDGNYWGFPVNPAPAPP